MAVRGAFLGLLAAGVAAAAAKSPTPSPAVSSVGECHHSTSKHIPLSRQINEVCPPPLTDSSKIPTGAPWTHPIRCLIARNETTKTEKGYCLYTDALYGDGHGASVIGTPWTVSDLVGNDAYEDRPTHGATGKRKFVTGPVDNGKGPSYRIGPTPGKGLGVFANRKIEQGEILMLDFPAMLVAKQFLEDAQPKLRRRLLKRGFSQLPQATQDKVFSLAKSTGGEAIDDILGTNTCSLTLGDREVFLGLYPEVAVSCGEIPSLDCDCKG
jgi:hypothetical protein